MLLLKCYRRRIRKYYSKKIRIGLSTIDKSSLYKYNINTCLIRKLAGEDFLPVVNGVSPVSCLSTPFHHLQTKTNTITITNTNKITITITNKNKNTITNTITNTIKNTNTNTNTITTTNTTATTTTTTNTNTNTVIKYEVKVQIRNDHE